MMKPLFFISSFLVFHAYVGYPLSLHLMSLVKTRRVRKSRGSPMVTMIITAHNEEQRIRRKIENTLSLDYPRERLQILVTSDGSMDGTDRIVEGYRSHGVELLSIRVRGGKENAQREAVRYATGEVLVFSDVATTLDPQGLKEIVSNFADPSVGCVSSKDRVIDQEGRAGGEGFYVRYEMWLRSIESKVNSLVGLSGSFFAARKEVCQDFSAEMQSDFRTVLSSMKLGLRAVIDPDVIGYYLDIADEKREFDRKVRTVLRGLTVFFRHLEFLNVFQYGLFSYQYLCHKLLRWSVPFLLSAAFLSNLMLIRDGWPYAVAFVAQVLFYGVAYRGWKRGPSKGRSVLKIPTYFVTVNAAVVAAWWLYLRGQRVVMWNPSER